VQAALRALLRFTRFSSAQAGVWAARWLVALMWSLVAFLTRAYFLSLCVVSMV
jgi:hypothetical protein